MTRGSITGQVKALSMIVAIEGLIPDRRAVSAPPPVNPQIDTAARLREQQGKTTGPQPGPDLVRDEDGRGVPDPPPGAAQSPPPMDGCLILRIICEGWGSQISPFVSLCLLCD